MRSGNFWLASFPISYVIRLTSRAVGRVANRDNAGTVKVCGI